MHTHKMPAVEHSSCTRQQRRLSSALPSTDNYIQVCYHHQALGFAAALSAAAGSIFCVLLVLAILTTKPYNFSKTGPFGFAHHSSNGSSNGPYTDGPLGLWSEGGHADFADLAAEGLDQAGTVSCKGSSLRCDVVNRIPKPEVG